MAEREHQQDLVKGTVELMVLGVLADESRHGLAVFDEIASRSNRVLLIAEGSVYPALKRLEAAGWLTSEWRRTALGRRARYYTITDAGRRQLQQKRDSWMKFANAVTTVIDEFRLPAGGELPRGNVHA